MRAHHYNETHNTARSFLGELQCQRPHSRDGAYEIRVMAKLGALCNLGHGWQDHRPRPPQAQPWTDTTRSPGALSPDDVSRDGPCPGRRLPGDWPKEPTQPAVPGAGRKPTLPWAAPRLVFDGFRPAEVERFIVFSQKQILRSRSPTVWSTEWALSDWGHSGAGVRKSVLGVSGTVALAAETRNDALERRQGRGRPGQTRGPAGGGIFSF